MIVNDGNLTSLHKLHYLKSCLTDEPAKLLSVISTTDQNFDIAMDLLIKPYHNKKLIIRHHMAQIMDIPEIKRPNSNSLRNLIDMVELNLKYSKNKEYQRSIGTSC